MCGIAGFFGRDPSERPTVIKTMLNALTHRGPDAEGIWTDKAIALGHRRLSIQDTSSIANQPMMDTSERFVLVFNGEIYNFRELRNKLIGQGTHFKTTSDTEVILELWSLFGEDSFAHLEGMFALAIWDREKHILYLARDRFGEKPLFYFMPPQGGIAFSSELKSLKLHPLCPKILNPKAISQFLSLNYILTDSCIYSDVLKLSPGCFLKVDASNHIETHSYWSLANVFHEPKTKISPKDFQNELIHHLEDAVQKCSISDVPLGAFLSGGIDSSAIVAAMKRNSNISDIETFSIGFTEKSYNELSKALTISTHIGTLHKTKTIALENLNVLEQIIHSTDEPFADSSMIPTYFLAQFARQHVTVCLSGDGGDELFAGYETYKADRLRDLLNWIPCQKSLLSFATHLLPTTFNKVSRDYKARKFLTGLSYAPQYAHYFWRTIFSESEKKMLLHARVRDKVIAHDPFETFKRYYLDVSDCAPLDQHLYVDLKTWLVDDILVKVDRMSMAHSLEVRAPFLNHLFAEWAIKLPTNMKLSGLRTKYILKKSQERFLPKSSIYAKKEGFNAPVSHWMGPVFKERMLDNSFFCDWFNRPYLEQLWSDHEHRLQDNGLKLFGLLCLSIWMEKP